MEIILNITEDSKVELIKDGCEAVQGEHHVTILNINFPSTIKGYSIDNYIKQIEFGECKEFGECIKFLDTLDSNKYELCSTCTQFEKLMIQFTLKNLVDEAEPIVWKTIPFALEFCESINAEKTKEVQATLLSLAEIKKEWENYIKSNTLRMIYKVGDVPTADATSLGDTIFYLGANTESPYILTYGHYYRCNYVNGSYEWTDLTQDPSLEGVANGIREINNNQTMQIWVGNTEELENEVIEDNVLYLDEDYDIEQTFDEVLTAMIGENEELLLDGKTKHVPVLKEKLQVDSNGVLKYGDIIIPQKKLLAQNCGQPTANAPLDISSFGLKSGDKIEIFYKRSTLDVTNPLSIKCIYGIGRYVPLIQAMQSSGSNGSGLALEYIQLYFSETSLFFKDSYQLTLLTGQTTFYSSDEIPQILSIYKIVE